MRRLLPLGLWKEPEAGTRAWLLVLVLSFKCSYVTDQAPSSEEGAVEAERVRRQKRAVLYVPESSVLSP